MTSYRLIAFAADRIHSQGTGWLVSSDRVVTAFHVVGELAATAFFNEGLDDVRYVLLAGDSEHELRPLIFDKHADIALLSLVEPATGLSKFRLASSDRQAPDVLWRGQGFPGFHSGRPFTLTGKVIELRGWYAENSMQLLVDQEIQASWKGVSGAPVIDKRSGMVIGLITHMTDNTSTGWAATTTAIERLLTRYDNRPAESQRVSDPRSLYRLWIDISDKHKTDLHSNPADLLHRLYKECQGRDDELETIVRWLLDEAWPDLLIEIVAALERTALAQLLEEARGGLIGSRRLAIHLLWHPDCQHAEALAKAIFSALSRPADDAAAFGLGIPIFFWKKPGLELLDLHQAQRSLVLVLIDDEMVLSEEWRNALYQLSQRIPEDDPRHRLVPCALTVAAKNLDERLDYRTFLDLSDYDETLREHILLIRLTHRLVNLLEHPGVGDEAKVRLFVSYARSDGSPLVEKMQMCLAKNSLRVIEIIVDKSHAVSGARIATFLGKVRDAVVVALQTDAYSSRDWCKREILLAKKDGAPILAVNALNEGEVRTFPYLGNVRTIRLPEQGSKEEAIWPLQVIRGALIELLSHRLFHGWAHTLIAVGLVDKNTPCCSRPPELLTIGKGECVRPPNRFLYPDPPLSDAESDVLKSVAPQCVATTPATLISEHFPRRAMRVALSISDPTTLAQQGLDVLQLHDMWVALTRHLLLSGAQLAYGLDLRAGGYGEIMLRLLEQRSGISRYKCDPVRSLIAWPLHLTPDEKKSTSTWADLSKVVSREPIDLPPLARAVERTVFLPPDSLENLYVWCKSLTYMRHKLMEEVDALVAIGGQLSGYKGKYPGVVEEVKIALERDLPVFIVGGFGGCGDAMARASRGLSATELTLEHQAREQGRRELIEYYNREIESEAQPGWRKEKIDYDRLRELFANKNVRGLNNGLSIAENERLFATTSVNEIVWLVLKGLSAIRKG